MRYGYGGCMGDFGPPCFFGGTEISHPVQEKSFARFPLCFFICKFSLIFAKLAGFPLASRRKMRYNTLVYAHLDHKHKREELIT